MNKNIFSINIHQFKVNNWIDKKGKLLKLFDNSNKKKVENVIASNSNMRCKFFSEEIKKIEEEYRTNFYISEMWFQKYDTNMDHAAHTHGPMGISSVCFVEYDKNEHKPTAFISPFSNSLSGNNEVFQPTVEEGDIIFFPSNLLHYAPVNTSEKQRVIVSFNLKVDFKKNIMYNKGIIDRYKYM